MSPPIKRRVAAPDYVASGTSSTSKPNKVASRPSAARTSIYTDQGNPSPLKRVLQGGYDGLDWLEPTLPDEKDCPLGFVCSPTGIGKPYPCKDVQDKAITLFNFGRIHDGMYCPANSSRYENCPVGFYCPNSTAKVPCPSGFFCPHKTAKPEIVCSRCGEQSTTMIRARWGAGLIIAVAALLTLVFVVYRWNHWYQKRRTRLTLMEERFISADRERLLKEREKEQLERIRPHLEEIAKRLESMIQDQRRQSEKRFSGYNLEIIEEGDAKDEDNFQGVQFQSNPEEEEESEGRVSLKKEFLGVDVNGQLWFDADILFDTLDIDNSGDLSYQELNSVLQLDNKELQHFVETMNELGGIKGGDMYGGGVPRQVFIEHFLEALEISSNYRLSEQDAAKLFDDVVKAGGGRAGSTAKLKPSQFFGSRVNHFMSEAQINAMIKRLRDRKENFHADGRQRSRRGSLRGDLKITKSEFIKIFPEALGEVEPTARTHRSEIDNFREESRMAEGFDIAFSDFTLSVSVAGKKVNVVDRVKGRLQARTMTALMGGSGTGKTSLLNALCGRASYGEVSGTIRINGHVANIEDHKDNVGFVPQDDIVYPELTVRENLIYSGSFQLKAGTSRRDIEDLADETLANLGLTKVKDSRVGDVSRRGVSGGERKRVNIGIELMRKPSILFLDEPTSGLDSSSAMLLVKCLKNLVDTRGITVCGVIHQPRKYIFDIFDSLILLTDGGRIVYEGPTDEAEEYFSRLNYVLPSGEGVSDWLIDISSGRLRPLKSGQKSKKALAQSYYQKTPIASKKTKKSSSTGNTIEKSLEKAKIARENLIRCWNDHFSSLPHHQKEQFLPPKAYRLPKSVKRPGFFRQLSLQTRRNVLIIRRNWLTKFIDTFFIVGAVVLISALEGNIELTVEHEPFIPYDKLVSDNPDDLVPFFPMLFAYAMKASTGLQEYALKVGVIIAVLVGLAASRVIIDKRLQFYREAASGYDTTAYFIAINLTSTIEHFSQIVLCVVCAYWLRQSASHIYSYFFSFFLLAWLCISWSFLLAILVPPKNAVVVIGFFMALFGLLFSGGLSPVLYKDIYDPDRRPLAAFCGFVSPTRYFIEAMAVAEHRALPAQSGFTYIAEDATQFPADSTSFDFLSLAQNDSSVVVRSDKGWYWSALPGVIVGVAVRVVACGFLIYKAKQQGATPLRQEMRNQLAKPFLEQLDLLNNVFFWMLVAFVISLYMVGVSIWLILRQT